MRAVGIGCQDGCNRTMFDLFHDEERSVERASPKLKRDRFGNRKAKLMECLIGAKFRCAIGIDQAGDRITAQDERPIENVSSLRIARAKAVGFPARTAGDTRKIRNLHRSRTQLWREIGSKAR